jgi:hypothetical protein
MAIYNFSTTSLLKTVWREGWCGLSSDWINNAIRKEFQQLLCIIKSTILRVCKSRVQLLSIIPEHGSRYDLHPKLTWEL